MKQYEKYKDSGIEWLGEIPEHWQCTQLKHLIEIVNGFAFKSEDLGDKGYPVIRIGDIESIVNTSNAKRVNIDIYEHLAKYRIFSNDLMFAMTGATIGKTGVYKSNEISFANQRTCIFRAKPIFLQHFLQFVVESAFFKEFIKLSCGGSAQENISSGQIEEFICSTPSIIEQQKIAEYLDYTVGQVDALVKEKEELIKKLQAKRKSLINEVVTKGLNPDAPMRDSGVEWLGEIPEHWSVTKINRTFELIGSGTTPKSGDEKYYLNGTINWLNTGDLNDGIITSTSKRITELAFDEFSTLKIYPKKSVVIALYGATIGKLGILDIDTTTNQACCVMSNSSRITQKYLFYFLLASRKYIISMSYGGGQPNISQELIRQLPILQLSIEEQNQIVNYIEERTKKIDKISEELKAQIKKLKAYKTAIISEAVTGKIDLREWLKPIK